MRRRRWRSDTYLQFAPRARSHSPSISATVQPGGDSPPRYLVDVLDVMLGSARGYVQVPRDLSVRKTLGLELQNLDLPVAEPGRSKARLFLQGVPSRVRNGGDGVGVESPLLGLVLSVLLPHQRSSRHDVAGSVRQTARGPRSFGSPRVSFLALRTKWWRDALTSATTAACGAEDGRRPPAGDAPAAAGGGLDYVEEISHSWHCAATTVRITVDAPPPCLSCQYTATGLRVECSNGERGVLCGRPERSRRVLPRLDST